MEESSVILFFAHAKGLEEPELAQTVEVLAQELRQLLRILQVSRPARLVTAREAWADLWQGRPTGKLQWSQWVEWVAVGTLTTGQPNYDIIVVPSHVPGNATVEILKLALLNRRPVLVWDALAHTFTPLLAVVQPPDSQEWVLFQDEANRIEVPTLLPPPVPVADPGQDPSDDPSDETEPSEDDVSTEEFPPEAPRLFVPMDLNDL